MKNGWKMFGICALFTKFAFAAGANKNETFNPVMRLSIAKTTLKAKDTLKLSVSIANKGQAAVTLVQPGDGSEVGWRTPIIGLSVLKQNKDNHWEKFDLGRGVRCGNINPLKAEEIFTLAPGEFKSLNVGWLYLSPFSQVGKYKVRFLYSNQPDLKWAGVPLGKNDTKAMEQIRNSTKCSLASNEVVRTVTK